jgi:hypothetical protein
VSLRPFPSIGTVVSIALIAVTLGTLALAHGGAAPREESDRAYHRVVPALARDDDAR